MQRQWYEGLKDTFAETKTPRTAGLHAGRAARLRPDPRKTKDMPSLFAPGLQARYPNLDVDSTDKILENPALFLQDGFCQAINEVHKKLRPIIIAVVENFILPDDDLSPTVKLLNQVAQVNVDVLTTIDASAC